MQIAKITRKAVCLLLTLAMLCGVFVYATQTQGETMSWEQTLRNKLLINGQFPTTKDGLTYGPFDLTVDGKHPDLIPVVATEGSNGYARFEDLNPVVAHSQGNISEEEMKARLAARNESMTNGTYELPLYDLDGNIVGKSTTPFNELIESTSAIDDEGEHELWPIPPQNEEEQKRYELGLPPKYAVGFPDATGEKSTAVTESPNVGTGENNEALHPQSEEEAAALGIPTHGWRNDDVSDQTNPFTDVKESSPFFLGILFAVQNGITNGTTSTTFSPSNPCTQAHILTFLWRACGKPEPTISNPFRNLQTDAYYAKAAIWAYEKGLIDNSSFNFYAPCTRLNAVMYMWKLFPHPPTTYSDMYITHTLYADEPFPFTDVPQEDIDALNAVAWASMSWSVTNGTSETTFSPDNTCTRGQIATFIYRGWNLFKNYYRSYQLEYQKSLSGQFTEKKVASREETELKQQAMRDKYLVNGQFPTTADGLTYGPLDLMVDGQFPDLVMVSATKGKDGYARLEDFSPMFSKDRDSLSEQEYLARIDAYNESILNGTFTIPLYDLSGNIVGEYSSSAFYPQDESSES